MACVLALCYVGVQCAIYPDCLIQLTALPLDVVRIQARTASVRRAHLASISAEWCPRFLAVDGQRACLPSLCTVIAYYSARPMLRGPMQANAVRSIARVLVTTSLLSKDI